MLVLSRVLGSCAPAKLPQFRRCRQSRAKARRNQAKWGRNGRIWVKLGRSRDVAGRNRPELDQVRLALATQGRPWANDRPKSPTSSNSGQNSCRAWSNANDCQGRTQTRQVGRVRHDLDRVRTMLAKCCAKSAKVRVMSSAPAKPGKPPATPLIELLHRLQDVDRRGSSVAGQKLDRRSENGAPGLDLGDFSLCGRRCWRGRRVQSLRVAQPARFATPLTQTKHAGPER